MAPRRSGVAGQVERTASRLMATSCLREEALFGIVGRNRCRQEIHQHSGQAAGTDIIISFSPSLFLLPFFPT